MLNLLKRIRHFESREKFLKYFFSMPEHDWIISDKYIMANLHDFFDHIPLKHINYFFADRPVYFVLSSGKYSCSVEHCNDRVIIVFPELYRLLKSSFDGYAKAILAHELGHLYQSHANKSISILEAQVEADTYAINLGLASQLAEFLEEQPESIEKRVRLSFVTSSIFSNQ